MVCGHTVVQLGRAVRVCVSARLGARQGVDAGQEHICQLVLAAPCLPCSSSAALVSTPVEPSGGLSLSASGSVGSAHPAQIRSFLRVTQSLRLLACILSSDVTARRVLFFRCPQGSPASRKFSLAVFESKWIVFCAWCRGSKTSLLRPPPS